MIAWLYRKIIGDCFWHKYEPFGNRRERFSGSLEREYYQVHRCTKCNDFRVFKVLESGEK